MFGVCWCPPTCSLARPPIQSAVTAAMARLNPAGRGVRGKVWPAAWKVFFSLWNGLPSDSYRLKPVNIGCVLTAGSPGVFFFCCRFFQDSSWLALSITNMLAWHTFLSWCRSLFQSICAAKSAVTVLCSGDAQIEERGMSFLSALCSVLYANLKIWILCPYICPQEDLADI